MENSVDALKLAFGVLVFVFALTLAFMLLAQAKQTADVVFFASDKTNYYQYQGYDQRVVGVDTLIATLYRYYNDSVRVTIINKYGEVEIFDTSLEKNAPWIINSEMCKKSIDCFISGNLPTGDMINGTKVKFDNNPNHLRGYNDGGTFSIAKTKLSDMCSMSSEFIETFDEVKYSGSYIVDGDETLKQTAGGTKLYITYTEQ